MPVHVLIAEKEKEEAAVSLGKRNSTSVILKVVERSMGRHPICGHIYVGILEKGLLYATGYFAEKDLPGVTSYRGIEEPTQVKNVSSVRNVQRDS